MSRDRYVRLGAGLLAAGAFVLPTSLLLLASHAGVSTGIALLVLGLVILLIGKTAPGLSPELADLLVRTGYENLGRLFEEVGLQSRAVYLPSSSVSGSARALIPLNPDDTEHVSGQMDDRLVVFSGSGPDDLALLVTTPGCLALGLLQYSPGPTMDEIHVALTKVAVATLRVAQSIDLHERGDSVEVRFSNETTPSSFMASAVEWSLGSLAGSIAAALVAEAKGRSVTIESESVNRSTRTVVLRLHSL